LSSRSGQIPRSVTPRQVSPAAWGTGARAPAWSGEPAGEGTDARERDEEGDAEGGEGEGDGVDRAPGAAESASPGAPQPAEISEVMQSQKKQEPERAPVVIPLVSRAVLAGVST
jgi:hypothetical protein